MKIKKRDVFQKMILTYFSEHGRKLPWRKNISPYHIFVSEVMLQQTQVDRVIPKYNTFIKQFPSFLSLSKSSLSTVLFYWSGLGYNRRAKFLLQSAKIIREKYNGKVPQNLHDLMTLPGIGPYTAGAIKTFTYNTPEIFIETNIRAVYIHTFLKNKENIADGDIIPLIKETLFTENPRTWYWALMDYGNFLKRSHRNPSRQSSRHTKQSKFVGSDRQLRGVIIKSLLLQSRTLTYLQKRNNSKRERIQKVLNGLIKDEMIILQKSTYKIK